MSRLVDLRLAAWFTPGRRRLAMWLLALGVVAYLFVSARNDRQRVETLAVDTNTALCIFRNGLEAEIDGSEEFLDKHPNGAFGFTRSEIEQGIEERQGMVDALSILRCKPVPK